MTLVLGSSNGRLNYYRNDGNGIYTERTGNNNPFDGIDVDSNAQPTFVDIDGDSEDDLVLGRGNGQLHYYRNNGNGTIY